MMNRYFRGDAAFAQPELYENLEAEHFHYAIRMPSNDILHREIEHLTKRPVGRPSHKPKVFSHSFMYQAKSWNRPRRVVAKVEWHHDELFPRIGFIVTDLNRRAKNVVRFYNKRGTAEQWIKEGKLAITWTRLSCHGFRENEVRLQQKIGPRPGYLKKQSSLGECNQKRRDRMSSLESYGKSRSIAVCRQGPAEQVQIRHTIGGVQFGKWVF